jgi:DNA-binding CsgD family transcriptional regulator
MWRKKLQKLIPSDLHKFFSLTDSNGDDEARRFGFEAETVELKAESTPQLIPKDQEYLLGLWDSLTRRQQEVVALVCLGLRNYEIAEAMGIAHSTVKWHLEEIFDKLNMPDRVAIRFAFQGWDFQSWWMNGHILPIQGRNTP